MKVFLAAALGILLVALLVTSGIRLFSSVTTRVDMVYPKPGVECALASTADGAALSCWKADK
jgi:hypothetical protein